MAIACSMNDSRLDHCNALDSEMSVRSHISHFAASYFSAMRQIRSIRRSLPSAALQMLVISLVYSRLVR